jgi:hypothetical protein
MPSINTKTPTADEVAAMTDQQRKVLENRLRRAADRQGMRLEKSRLRDPRAIGYGTFMLTDAATDTVVYAGDAQLGYGLGLDDVARYLYGDRDGR